MFKLQDQKSEKGHRTKVHAWFGKRNLKKNMETTKCPLPTPGCTLSTSLLSSHPSSLTSLLAPHPYSLHFSTLHLSTLSRPDSLAFLLSHVPTPSHLYSLRIPALSTSLLSLNPYSLTSLLSTSWKFVKRSLGPSKLPLKFFLKEFTEHQHLLEGWLIESRPKRPSLQDDAIVWLQGYIRRPGPGLGWPIHHLRVSMSNFGWFEGTSILENLHVTTRKLNGMMVCTE